MRFSIKILILIVQILAAFQQNAISVNVMQEDFTSSGLTGGYRPAEIGRIYQVPAKNWYCSGSLAKYVVSIRKVESQREFGKRHICGGVIIRSNLILSAAHCFQSKGQVLLASSIRVVASTPIRLLRTSETQIVRVRRITIHEMFTKASNVDVALLKLQQHLQLDGDCAAAVDIPQRSINVPAHCVVLGWGKLYANGPMANEILEMNVTLHSKRYCEPFFMNSDDRKLCASDRMDNEKHPCSGDSGGPLFCDDVLTGIVSYGFRLGGALPTVYTDVYEHRHWISENESASLKISLAFYCSVILIYWWN